ncbi:hypothetical protein KC980_00415 [candidate division WWE3 bacterium]|uniref:Uncharacterized protein n=1 Tax=candidate division WWE3 bacterium TaxID=2053526 RepID=A0A955J2W1_UNCKA|nr:hypothetical protein [candidate division WWE3 bacterium]
MFDLVPKETLSPLKITPITTIGGFLGIILNIIGGVGIAASVGSLLVAGIKYAGATHSGNPKAKDIAKNALTYAVVALVLALMAMTLKVIILNTLGVDNATLNNATPDF